VDIKTTLDYITETIRAANPSAYSLVEATLPYTTPMPIAVITAASATTYFKLEGLGTFLFVYSLEGIGLVATTKLMESIVAVIRSRNPKTVITTIVLILAVISYVTILVSINVTIHNEFKATPSFGIALTLICFLPLIAGILNGLSQVKEADRRSQQKIDEEAERLRQESADREERLRQESADREERLRQESADREERLRQEEREDRRQRWMLKHGFSVDQPQTKAQDPGEDRKVEKMPGDYKAYVFQLLDEFSGEIELSKITELVNKNKRANLAHGDAKGTWLKWKQAWLRGERH